MTEAEAVLVFIPCPGAGHLVSAVEFAKLLVDRDARLSIVCLLMKMPFESTANAHIEKATASTGDRRIRFIQLPNSVEDSDVSVDPRAFFRLFIENQKPHVKEAVAKLSQPGSPRLAGFVIDLFCTPMIQVAKEFRVPTYVFFTCNAGFLSLVLHLQTLNDEHGKDVTEFNDSDEELVLPGLANPLPAKLLPFAVIGEKANADYFLDHARRFRETQGILVNTFAELEPGVLNSLSADSNLPPVYPVGPVVNVDVRDEHTGSDLIKWLDDQPPSSVVFLCFGSRGSLEEQQVKEIARALEKTGYRFLWSLRRNPPKGKLELPCDYADPAEVLPEGFLDRTAEVGRVVGWAPQVAVLAHPAVGAFVSHCGWNSTLESIWFGVPVATWPMYAEQQFNAFCLLKEFGLAVEVKMDYQKDFFRGVETMDIGAEEIEEKIRAVMELDAEKRKRVKEMSHKSRAALNQGGSSYVALGRLIHNVLELEKP